MDDRVYNADQAAIAANERLTQQMLLILALDDDAVVRLSPYTRKWYVAARIEVKDGGLLSSPVFHATSPEEAVRLYLENLQGVESPQVLVVNAVGGRTGRRHYLWNGATWWERPVDRELLAPEPTEVPA